MKNTFVKVKSFAAAKLQAKRRGLLAIIALAAIIGFAMTACSSGDGDEKTLVSIEVTTQPTKTHYNLGEDLDTTGMVVTATYSDGSTAAVTGFSVDGYDKTKIGHHVITVTFNGKTAEFSVNVADPTKPTVTKPTADPVAGTYTTAQSVTLTTTPADAKIYYTTDGTEPTEGSTLYSGAISISVKTTLRAYAVLAGYNDSDELVVEYIFEFPFTSEPALTLEPDNGKIIYTWTASDPAADSYDVYWKTGNGLTAADVKTGTKIAGAASGGEITGLTNGTAYSVLVTANKANYKSIDSIPETATPAIVYKITGSGTTFSATKNGVAFGTTGAIQTVIDAIRTDVAGAACIIHFGDGEAALDIGTATASFNNTGGTWGLVELEGKITGSSTNTATSGTNATITIANAVSVTSTADIANTGATNGRAIYFNSTGTLTISGGTVSGATGYAVTNASTGAVNITGGSVSATTGRAVSNNAGGSVTISSGTISATTGSAVYNNADGAVSISSGTVSSTTGYAVYNYIGGAVSISGGIVQATETGGCAVQNNGVGTVNISGGTVSAMGNAVYNNAAGKITVSGTTTRITSANVTSTSGTIYLRSSGAAIDPRLVIEGGTVENTANSSNARAIYNASTGAVTISGGTVQATETGGYAVYNSSTGAVTISGGIVSATTGNALFNNAGGAVNISGGTISATTGRAVYNQAATGAVNISGGTVKTTNPNNGTVYIVNGAIAISGGTVSANSGSAVYYSSTNKLTISGTAKVTSANQNAENGGTITLLDPVSTSSDPRLEITGGTVENTSTGDGNAIMIRNNGGNVTISGGTVSKAGTGNYAIKNDSASSTVTIDPAATIVGNKNW